MRKAHLFLNAVLQKQALDLQFSGLLSRSTGGSVAGKVENVEREGEREREM